MKKSVKKILNNEEEVSFSNTFVWIGYVTTQAYSATGEEWREVPDMSERLTWVALRGWIHMILGGGGGGAITMI